MNKYLKNTALGLVFVIVLIVVFNLFNSPKSRVDSQNNIAEQQKSYQNLFKESEAQLERSKRLYERAEALQQRNETLVQKWEEQAKRIDAILTRYENKK